MVPRFFGGSLRKQSGLSIRGASLPIRKKLHLGELWSLEEVNADLEARNLLNVRSPKVHWNTFFADRK